MKLCRYIEVQLESSNLPEGFPAGVPVLRIKGRAINTGSTSRNLGIIGSFLSLRSSKEKKLKNFINIFEKSFLPFCVHGNFLGLFKITYLK